MNPELDTTPGLGLPQPSAETRQTQPGYAPEAFRGPEISAPRFEAMAPPSASALPVAAPPLQPATQPQPSAAPFVPVASDDAAMQEDDDADTSALDAEWVNKAREIVERTHTDPYTQSQELGRIKAQYIKARYSKEIKVSEEP